MSWGCLPSIGSYEASGITWKMLWCPVVDGSRAKRSVTSRDDYIPFCGVAWLLIPMQNMPWDPGIIESCPVGFPSYCLHRKICRGVQRVMSPLLWCSVSAESWTKCAVECCEWWIPPETRQVVLNPAQNTPWGPANVESRLKPTRKKKQYRGLPRRIVAFSVMAFDT